MVLSRAWCEAVVQRGINYVDPVNSPETPARQVNMKSGALEDTELSAVNKAFGRKFNIVSFRWLSPSVFFTFLQNCNRIVIFCNFL